MSKTKEILSVLAKLVTIEKRPIMRIIDECFASDIELRDLSDEELLENLTASLDIERQRKRKY